MTSKLFGRGRMIAWTAMAGVGALALAACGSGGGSGSTSANSQIIVCEVAATSGPFTQLGSTDMQGADAYVKMINKQGGVLGHKITLVKENDQSNPAQAASLVRKCVTQDHANFIFGPEETSTAAAGMPVADSLKTIMLGWQSGWEDIGLSDSILHSQYVFPAIGDVFHADDLATVQKLILPRHYTKVAVIEDNAPGGLGNDTYTGSLAKNGEFKIVSTQIATPGSTNDTPQALAMLKAKPQIIVLGMIPGADTITAIKAIRAQDPNIPISECSGCALPSFIQGAGGPTAMKNVYLLGSPDSLTNDLANNATNGPAIADTKNYIAAMKAAGYDQEAINGSSEGWDAGRELVDAIKTANSIDTNAVSQALQHQKIVVAGLQGYYFARTPDDHGNITNTVSAMDIVAPDGSVSAAPVTQ
ncbi:MAG TPA: ABC transporter substrate-binding protein [Pseudonocardiaceae bacterium]|nr:ABC transporter substrate-binding protein [Pseudonocardiaceae bacterium]